MVLNNELLEELLQLQFTISPMGIGPPVGKFDHDYKVVIQHFWLIANGVGAP